MRGDNAESFEQALIAYRRAVSLNGDDAEAWAGIGSALYTLGANNLWARDPADTLPEAAEAVAQALSIDPNEPTARCTRARLNILTERDFAAAERDFLIAMATDPYDSTVLVSYAEMLAVQRRCAKAWSVIQLAYQMNPADFAVLSQLYWVGVATGRYRYALQAIDELDGIIPHPFINDWARAMVFNLSGKPERGIPAMEKSLDQLINSARAPLAHILAISYIMTGRASEADSILQRLVELSRDRPGFNVPIAAVYLALGDVETSLDWLEKSVSARDPGVLYLSLVPAFAPIYQTERYREILRRAGLPEWSSNLE